MKIRIRWDVEQDDLEVRGNALASGIPSDDKACEDEIIRRLNAGDVWAWCWVKCEARCEIGDEVFIGVDSLGGCSYANAKDFMASDYASSMRECAIQGVFREMRQAAKKGKIASKALKAYKGPKDIEIEEETP